MNLETYVLIATISSLVIGLVLGLIRGSRRAVLRLFLVLLCVVGAYFLKDMATNALLSADIQGQNIEQMILSMLPEQFQNMSDVIMPVITVLLSVLTFLLCFGGLLFISWLILFPILKIFVKKGKKKHALVGGIVGLIQGAAVAFVMCVVLNGLFINVGNVMAAMNDDQQEEPPVAASIYASEDIDLSDGGSNSDNNGDFDTDGDDGQQSAKQLKELMDSITGYKDSAISKLYSKIGGKAFDLVASVNIADEEGNVEKVTLKGQIDAISSLLKLANNADKLQNINFGTDGIVGCADSIKEVFDLLNDINKDLSEESQKTLNKVVANVAANLLPPDIPIDVTVIDFTKVDFAQEGEIITDLASYAEKETITEQDAEHIVQKVIESDLIIPLLTSKSEDPIDLKLGDEQKQAALSIIEKYESGDSYSQEKIEKVKNFLGLNDISSDLGDEEQTPDQGDSKQDSDSGVDTDAE